MVEQRLENGIRLMFMPMEHVRSVAIGVFVNSGSFRETAKENGISHFIEHMMFKGTSSRSAKEIAQQMDAIGGNLNAFTSKEMTCFHARVLDEHLDQAVDILMDLIQNAALGKAEMELEKGVVLDEILMSEDTPEDVAFEKAGQNFFSGSRLGQPILGS